LEVTWERGKMPKKSWGNGENQGSFKIEVQSLKRSKWTPLNVDNLISQILQWPGMGEFEALDCIKNYIMYLFHLDLKFKAF
jgi:hypothetical protein